MVQTQGRGFCIMGVVPQGERRCHLQISGKSVEVGLLPRLPATLSLASPMLRSRLPVPSLLGLFGALLVLFQDLPGNLSHVPLTDPEVQKALAFAVLKYNHQRSDSPNYFKHLCLLKAERKGLPWKDYFLKVELVKTTCQKKAGRLTYRKIQECDRGKNKKGMCCFKITIISVNIMHSQSISCD